MMPSKLDAAAALESMESLDAMQGCVPAFDFSALGELSGQATEADQQFNLHYGTAQDEYLISCIYVSKIHSLTARAGRYGGGTWTKWYESKGLSEGSARTMVKNGDAFKSATVADLKCLPELTRRDLNLIARSGHADQFMAAAGDSQRVKELLEQLKAEQDRADTAEGSLTAALADVQGLSVENEKLKKRVDQAEQECMDRGTECLQATARATKAEARAKEAENQLEGARQVKDAALLRCDKLKAENDALKQQPIEVVVDQDEVQRQAQELADRQTSELQAKLDAVTGDAKQDARNAYDSILLAGRAMLNVWLTVKPQFAKLPENQREAACTQFSRTVSQINGEVAKCL